MSTLITDEASFTTSQARPQTDDVNAAKEGLPQIIQSNIPNPLLIFYRGEPEVLGTVQIFLGIVFLSFGIMFSIMCEKPCPYLDNITMSYVLIWSSALYIVSGSVSLATSLKPTIVKVRASLVMTMISIAAASYAILVVIPIFPSALYIPYPDTYVLACAYYNPHTECIGAFNPMCLHAGLYAENRIMK
ncbi:membrane-spanning 4-domains subfamily A member 4A-like isoform 2-T2 [Leptodactylus fuscus]